VSGESADGTPVDPRSRRLAGMVGALRVALVGLVLGCIGVLVLPEDDRTGPSQVLVGAVIAVPLLRVAWLGVRWARKGDWRFAGAAGALLAVVALAALVR
jgi:hypothetical protein